MTAKQQNEFRIQLQKKACRRAERRVELLEDDVSWKEVRGGGFRGGGIKGVALALP